MADADFATVYQALKPSLPVPDRIQIQFLYKLGPVPHGADEAAVVSWARTYGWRLKVLKSLGPRQWLVGSEVTAPKGWLAFNGETLLVLPVPRRQTVHFLRLLLPGLRLPPKRTLFRLLIRGEIT